MVTQLFLALDVFFYLPVLLLTDFIRLPQQDRDEKLLKFFLTKASDPWEMGCREIQDQNGKSD